MTALRARAVLLPVNPELRQRRSEKKPGIGIADFLLGNAILPLARFIE